MKEAILRNLYMGSVKEVTGLDCVISVLSPHRFTEPQKDLT